MNSKPPFGVIGYGAIGRVLVSELAAQRGSGEGAELPLLVRPKYLEEARAAVPAGVAVLADAEAFLGRAPATVIEAAGAPAVVELAERVLRAEADLVIASAAALTDDALYARIAEAARESGRQAIVASGALGSLDILAAMAAAGLERVTYRGIKPPAAWRGTPAEEACDLEGLSAAVTFFAGSAREAARSFPKNANVAALAGLAGLGLDETQVELVADPTASANRHEVAASGATGEMRFEVAGAATKGNARTSATTAYSLLEAARARRSPIVIGANRARG